MKNHWLDKASQKKKDDYPEGYVVYPKRLNAKFQKAAKYNNGRRYTRGKV